MPQTATRMTVFAIAMTCGILLALSAHMLSGRFGVGLPVRLDIFQANANPIAAALIWWAIAGAGFVGSFFAGLLAQDAADGPDRRGLRMLIGVLFFAMLVIVPHVAVLPPIPSLPEAIASNLLAFALGTVTAFCGSWFAAPR
jgi:hypothetical protein